jgi:hypothetical protein
MEGFFVEMDSHAIATLDYFLAPFVWVEKWEQGGHSMGLILEARSPFFAPFLTRPVSWVS